MDATLAVPRAWQLDIQRQLSDFHVARNKDFLFAEPPLWLQFFVVFELIFQLPLFVAAVVDYWKNKCYSPKLHPYMLLYGFNASFTTLCCLVYVYFESAAHGLTVAETLNLLGVYFPTFVIPAVMTIDFASRISAKISGKQHTD
ncbi:hypothetical protein KL912_004642 [Ogataea haglerorum]|nr:hypothetical protein KL912_004642 [Ogataea haglerorum]